MQVVFKPLKETKQDKGLWQDGFEGHNSNHFDSCVEGTQNCRCTAAVALHRAHGRSRLDAQPTRVVDDTLAHPGHCALGALLYARQDDEFGWVDCGLAHVVEAAEAAPVELFAFDDERLETELVSHEFDFLGWAKATSGLETHHWLVQTNNSRPRSGWWSCPHRACR